MPNFGHATNPASEAPTIVLTHNINWPMLDGDAEPGGRRRRFRTASTRLAAGGATVRRESDSLAPGGASLEVAAGLSPERPTDVELEAARKMRTRLEAAGLGTTRPFSLNVVACAMAMRKEEFSDDRAAKRLFKVHVDTKVRRDWLDGGVVRGKPIEARFERLARHEREVRRAAAAARITDVERRALAATAKAAAFRQKRLEQAARRAVRFRAQHLTIPAGARQCEGFTRATGLQCMVHSQCTFADAAPLRSGAAYCRHHDPAKFTGVQCRGVAKKTNCRCRVFSGSLYSQARPLQPPVNSPWCHFHRVRCRGVTLAGKRCCVTSSSLNTHARPLREGWLFCVHHAAQATSSGRASGPSTATAVPLVGELGSV